jgi:hypothetical protein
MSPVSGLIGSSVAEYIFDVNDANFVIYYAVVVVLVLVLVELDVLVVKALTPYHAVPS